MDKRAWRISALFVGLALTASMTACSTVSRDPSSSSADTLKQVKDSGELVVGVRQDQPPMSYEDKNGALVGFEVDMAKYIADKVGVRLVTKSVTSDTRIPLLSQGRVDMIAATVSHYRDRESAIDFSIGYFWADRTVLVRSDSNVRTLADLNGKSVGALPATGTLDELPSKVKGVKIQTFKTYQDAFLALEQGSIDGVGTDRLTLARLRAQSGDPSKYSLLQEATGASEFAIGVPENDSNWRDAVNEALQDMWVDGSWKAVFDKWLGPETEYNLTPADLNWTMSQWSIPAL